MGTSRHFVIDKPRATSVPQLEEADMDTMQPDIGENAGMQHGLPVAGSPLAVNCAGAISE